MAYNKKIEIQVLKEGSATGTAAPVNSGRDSIGNDRDDIGNDIGVWETVLNPWAEINCTGGREYYAAAQVNAQDDMVFKIRYSRKLKGRKAPELRIIYDGLTYDVKHIDDFMEQHRELVIRAEYRGGGAGDV